MWRCAQITINCGHGHSVRTGIIQSYQTRLPDLQNLITSKVRDIKSYSCSITVTKHGSMPNFASSKVLLMDVQNNRPSAHERERPTV